MITNVRSCLAGPGPTRPWKFLLRHDGFAGGFVGRFLTNRQALPPRTSWLDEREGCRQPVGSLTAARNLLQTWPVTTGPCLQRVHNQKAHCTWKPHKTRSRSIPGSSCGLDLTAGPTVRDNPPAEYCAFALHFNLSRGQPGGPSSLTT